MYTRDVRAKIKEDLEEKYKCHCPYGGRGEGGCSCGSDLFEEVAAMKMFPENDAEGNPIFYFTIDGEVLCGKCARTADEPDYGGTNWECVNLRCVDCKKLIPSVYPLRGSDYEK